MRLITINSTDEGVSVVINPRHVVCVYKTSFGCTIRLADGISVDTSASSAQIRDLIEGTGNG